MAKNAKKVFFYQGLKIGHFLKFHPFFLIFKLTDMKTKQKTLSCPLLLDCQKLVFLRESWPKFDNLLNVNFQVYSEGNSEIRERGQKNALIHSVLGLIKFIYTKYLICHLVSLSRKSITNRPTDQWTDRQTPSNSVVAYD